MKCLLDTHIWILNVADPARILPRVQKTISDPTSEVWLSPVSTWEALILNARGRILMLPDVDSWLSRALAHTIEAPLTHEIVVAATHFPFAHRDPADRFLAATAKVLGLTLVTADRFLLNLPGIDVLPNL